MPKIEISEETLEKIKEQLGDDFKVKEIESLDDLVGETFVFQCARYIYHGKVKIINSDYIELENASVIFNTGDYDAKQAEDKQILPHNVFVLRQSIEAFYKLKW